MLRFTAVVIFALASSAAPAGSATVSEFEASLGSGAVAGFGVASCASFSNSSGQAAVFEDAAQGPMYIAWAQGFLSGLNASNIYHRRQVVDLTGGRAAELWSAIVAGCRATPEKTVGTIAAEFYAHNMR